MKIDLTRLLNHYIEEIKIDDKIIITDDYLQNTEIRGISEIAVTGSITSTTDDLYSLNLNINGEMILPCAVTLDDVDYPFDIKIDEILSDDDEEDEKYIKIINNTIDIMPIIWQNIVMEIPIRVVSQKAEHMKLEGDGWRLITDEERNRETDPRLDKLKDLLDN
ncbi:MAG: YceD family protein [Bacilli bacterium]|nr:YceD family protein [Bacilli bacterium]